MFESLFSRRGLSLDRLRALLEVHDAGSISHAVPGNPVRHSQYSRQLRELSEFFGSEMAERRGKFVKLTANGTRLAEISREYLRALEDFTGACRGEHDHFTIAAGDSLMQWLIIPRLGALLKQLPKVRFATESSRTDNIIQDLSNLRVDFGLVRKNALIPGLQAADLGVLSYVAVVPKALVSKGRSPTLAQAFQLPLAIQTTDGQFGKQLFDIACTFAPAFEPALACQSFPQTLAAVRSGRFAAVLPELAAAELPPASVYKVTGEPLDQLSREYVLVWNRRMIGVRPLAASVADKMVSTMCLA
jgi:DNA-binding transcriptional LysR family regulator